jgi:hypothetical protein
VRRKCRARWDADHLEQEVGEGRVRISRETKTIVDDLVPALAEQLDSYNLQVESGQFAHTMPLLRMKRVGSVWAACGPKGALAPQTYRDTVLHVPQERMPQDWARSDTPHQVLCFVPMHAPRRPYSIFTSPSSFIPPTPCPFASPTQVGTSNSTVLHSRVSKHSNATWPVFANDGRSMMRVGASASAGSAKRSLSNRDSDHSQ